MPTLSGMTKTSARRPKSAKQVQWWRVSRISGARMIYLGEVEADTADEAVEKAAERFEVAPAHRNRLIARLSDF